MGRREATLALAFPAIQLWLPGHLAVFYLPAQDGPGRGTLGGCKGFGGALGKAPQSVLQAKLVRAGIFQDILPLPPPFLLGLLLLLVLVVTTVAYMWIFIGDLSHHQLFREA